MHESNRAGWNEGAARYLEQVERDIERLRAGHKNLCPPELDLLRDLGAWCRRAIHLQCAGGLDTLSLWRHGAAEVVGVDISDVMIECARRKSEALGAPATWYRCDVLDTPRELDGTADLVYTGRGALTWIQDLGAWAAVVARLLAPGGRLYVFETHPITWIFDPEAPTVKLCEADPNDPELGPFMSYFSERASVSRGWSPQYIGELDRPRSALSAKFERQWTIGALLNALIGAGLLLERFEEHPDRFWQDFPNMPAEIADRFPHSFSLLMLRPA